MNLLDGLELVAGAFSDVSLNYVDVVSFRSPNLEGMFKDGRVLISRDRLANRAKTLEVLVHEFAHRQGGDGEKGHVAAIEGAWSDIVEKLRSRPAEQR
jgi:hypothetical protein